MISNPIQIFISELKNSGIIPRIIPERLGELIAWTGNMNTPQEEDPGNMALAFAAAQGDLSLVQSLINLGADPKKVNSNYNTLLHIAVLEKNWAIIDFALSKMPTQILLLTDYDENNVFHFACENGDVKLIERLMADPRLHSLIHQKNLIGIRPIDIAISKANNPAIHLLDSSLNISALPEYGKVAPNLSQDHLEAQLTKYLDLMGIENKSEWGDIIFKVGMCNGWSWLRQIYLSQGQEEEYLALLTLISTWDGTQQGLDHQDLPLILKKKYQKIFQKGNVQPGDVGFVFEKFIYTLSVAFADTESFFETNLKILQRDRFKQYELLRSSMDERVLKNIFNIPLNYYNKEQLKELFKFVSRWPGLNMDITRRGHAVTLSVTPEGLLDYYDSGLKGKVDHFMTPEELAEHILKTDLEVDFELSAYKFYESEPVLDEIPIGSTFAGTPSVNGYTALHWAVLENNPVKVMDLIRSGSKDIQTPDAHGFTPLKLALRANHTACVLCLLSHNQNTPITHSDEIDFQKAQIDPRTHDLSTFPFKILFDPATFSINEAILLKNLMEQGDLSINFTDKNGKRLSDILLSFDQFNKNDPRYKELEQFFNNQKAMMDQSGAEAINRGSPYTPGKESKGVVESKVPTEQNEVDKPSKGRPLSK